MLHQRARVEFKGGFNFPFDTDIEPGSGVGIKGSIERFKNLYFGLEYNYFYNTIDETVAEFQDLFETDPVRAQREALGADPEQWLKHLSRHNILFTADYEIPLGDALGAYTPVFRFGLGLGAVLVDGREISSNNFADDVDVRFFAMFLARPEIAFHFPLHKNVQLFIEGDLELTPDGELVVEGDLFGRRTRIEDDVNFSAASVFGGVSVNW
jgi:hypothetical protein